MKKLAAILLGLCLLLGAAGLAENTDVTIEKVSFDFTMQRIEGVPYGYGIPKDWTRLDLTEDDIAWGMVGRFQSPDCKIKVEVTLEELTEAVTMDQLAQMMLKWKNYTDVGLMTINTRPFIGYQKVKEGTYGLATMIPQEDDEKGLLVDFDYTFAAADGLAARTGMEIASLFSEVAEPEE